MTVTKAFTKMVTTTFDAPLYGGGSTTSEVPGKWPVALNGRPYMIDTQVEHTFTDYWRHESIQLLRTQADPSSFPSEQTLNPEGLWRRHADSWHDGAGQIYFDKDDSADIYRFHTSKGIDPWTRYKLQLLPDTTQKRSSSNTNLRMVVAGSRLYVSDGQNMLYTTDLTTFTTVTGTHASTLQSLTSDGYYVYGAWGNGIGRTNTSTSAVTTAWNSLVCTLVAYVKGRLMAANANSIYNVTGSGGAPSALFTHGNDQFTWVGFAEGTANIYAAGYAGDKSLIYRIAVKPDASSLDQPIVAGELPSGEIIRSIHGYLGFVVVGTDKGWRFCDVDGQGNLTIGLLVTTTNSVYCFTGQDRFIWFGYTNYDATSTGVGRMDMTTFTQTLTPAWATDLMATVQGTVQSVVMFGTTLVFTVSASGFWGQSSNKVASGTLTTGLITYGVPDQKNVLFVDVRTEPLNGSYAVAYEIDNATSWTSFGSEATSGDTGSQFPTGQAIGQHIEVQFTLTRSASDNTVGPVFERWTMKAFPTTQDSVAAETHQVPLLLHRQVDVNGEPMTVDVEAEKQIIKGLRATRQLVILQEMTETVTGFVDDYKWVPHHLRYNPDLGRWEADGTMVINFKRVQ